MTGFAELLIIELMMMMMNGLVVMVTGGPGLLDPCEKDPIDALACLTQQQREDITNSAQVLLKCFQINVVAIQY